MATASTETKIASVADNFDAKAGASEATTASTAPDAKMTPPRLLVLDLHGTFVLEPSDDSDDEDGEGDESENKRSYVRPHAREFLVQAQAIGYDLAVWSASTIEEIHACLQVFWPFEQVGEPAFIFTHDHCTLRRRTHPDGPLGLYDCAPAVIVKKLSKVWKKHPHYSKHHTLVLDNTGSTFTDNYGNGILIRTYSGDSADKELLHVLDMLKHLAKADSVRCIDKKCTAADVAAAVRTRAVDTCIDAVDGDDRGGDGVRRGKTASRDGVIMKE